jgi:hypothetical protein
MSVFVKNGWLACNRSIDGKKPMRRTPVILCDIHDLGDLLSLSVGSNLLNTLNMNRGMPVVFPAK